jgi:hypothetical protein
VSTIDNDTAPLFADAVPWEEAQARLDALGLSDGLPLVPPTARRLAAMLEGVADPAASHGPMPPLFGELTAEAIAYNCVLAGCAPGAVPVVLTAVTAVLAPDFNLLGIATTTGTPAIAVAVHGPIAERLGMNSGSNCLGPGNAANASIGRAVQLVLRNVGGAHPGVADMATMGQPGKYTFAFAEAADGPLPGLATRRGIAAGQSAVTVLGVSGTMEVLPTNGYVTPQDVLRPLLVAMRGAAGASAPGRNRMPDEQLFLLPPELADLIVRAGWDLSAIQRFLYDDTPPVARSAADIHPIVTGGAGIKMTHLPLWMGGTLSMTVPLRTP